MAGRKRPYGPFTCYDQYHIYRERLENVLFKRRFRDMNQEYSIVTGSHVDNAEEEENEHGVESELPQVTEETAVIEDESVQESPPAREQSESAAPDVNVDTPAVVADSKAADRLVAEEPAPVEKGEIVKLEEVQLVYEDAQPAGGEEQAEAPEIIAPAVVNDSEAVGEPAPCIDETGPENKKDDLNTKRDMEELVAKVVGLQQRGIAGDKEAVKEAYELLQKALEGEPENNLLEAYLGSILALMGRDAIDPMERFKKVMQGLKILDRSVAKEPERIEIRILRARVCYPLPEKFFHRTATAVEDFEYLATRYENDPGVLSPEFYQQLLYDLGVCYKRLGRSGDAESVWTKLLSVTGETRYKELLRQEGMPVPDSPRGVAASPQAKLAAGKKAELIKEGLKFYNLARSGDKESTNKAYSFFKQAVNKDPDDPLFRAYYADCMSLTARDTMDPGEMFSTPIKAMKIFDSAVNSSPEDVNIRLLRAYHSFRLPEAFFRRTATAIADFEYLVNQYENDPSVLPMETHRQLLYDLGVAYQRLDMGDEAEEIWEKLLSLNPDPKYRTMLDEQRNNETVESRFRHLSVDDRETFYNEGFRLHDLAVAGNRAAAKEAMKLWEQAYEADPGDSVARAYLGSSMALVGRYSISPNALFGNAIKGLVHLNRAISRDRNNTKIRILRAYLAYSLPEVFFHQTKRAIKDFKFLKMAYEQDNSVFSEELYHKILYDLGMAYQRTNDDKKARKVWSKLLAVSPDPKYKSLLSERMGTGDES